MCEKAKQEINPQREIEDLVDAIVEQEDDNAARFFIRLIGMISTERDSTEREARAIWACNRAYTRTYDFSLALDKFERLP